jgi:hypothetical protein
VIDYTKERKPTMKPVSKRRTYDSFLADHMDIQDQQPPDMRKIQTIKRRKEMPVKDQM